MFLYGVSSSIDAIIPDASFIQPLKLLWISVAIIAGCIPPVHAHFQIFLAIMLLHAFSNLSLVATSTIIQRRNEYRIFGILYPARR